MSTLKYVKSTDILVAEQNGEGVFLHMGSEKYFTLNKIGMIIYHSLITNKPHECIIDEIKNKFDVESAIVKIDFEQLVNDLLTANIIEEIAE